MKTKRLAELKPGDRIWFEGTEETIKKIIKGLGPLYLITFENGTPDGWFCGACEEGDWQVPE